MNESTSRDRLWRKRLNELSAVWPDLVNGRTTGLHKTRVASRRIREALPVVAVDAPPDKVRKLNKKMRTLTRSLGPIRELDVELALLEERAAADGMPARVLEAVRRDVASRRQALRRELKHGAPIGDLSKLLKKLERVAGGKGAKAKGRKKSRQREAAWRGMLATRLVRRAKRLDAALEEAGPVYAADRLHAVRISVKKLRYALEIARDASVSGVVPLLKVLKRHQERLGHLHDLQVLLMHVREADALAGGSALGTELAAYADSLDRECRRLHAAFVERRGELAAATKDIRQHVVAALTTPARRQAHASARPRQAGHAHARAK
jgi:CHAD domain-containing protein